ncbi:tail tube protein [Synechococcus phage S-CREM2]|nr:tail tube protein [Synechococcus phage S-CREM2]
MSQRSIEDFKAILQGGGVRPTMFQVELTFPTGVSRNNNRLTNDGTFLIKATALPASTIGVIDVPFRGRKLKVSGDREFADWNVNILNDVSFGLREGLEEWSERIQNHNYALGAPELNDYYASAIVRQLDRDGRQLRAYSFEGIWPREIEAINLDFEANNAVEDYGVTFAVQYWSATRNGDPRTSNNPVDANARTRRVVS